MRGYFDRLRWALHFAGQTLYAVVFSHRVRFFFAKWVPRRVNQLIQRNRANVYAYSVSDTGVPVYGAGCSVNTELLRGYDGSPNFVSVMFANYLAFCLKIRVYRQKSSPLKNQRNAQY